MYGRNTVIKEMKQNLSKSVINSRVTGYIEAMKEFNLPVDEKYIYDGQYKVIGGYNAGKDIVSRIFYEINVLVFYSQHATAEEIHGICF